MMFEITAVRYGGARKTEQTITRYQLRNPETGVVSEADKETLVEWVDAGTRAYVGDGPDRAWLRVVRSFPNYLRTQADAAEKNNLTSLREF